MTRSIAPRSRAAHVTRSGAKESGRYRLYPVIVGVVNTEDAAACARSPPIQCRPSGERRSRPDSSAKALRSPSTGRRDWCRCQPLGKNSRERGPGHERGVVSEPPADLLDRGAQQQGAVGALQPDLGLERDLDLAGAPLVLDRGQRQAQRDQFVLQVVEQLVDLVVPVLGEVLEPVRQALHPGWCPEASRSARARASDRAGGRRSSSISSPATYCRPRSASWPSCVAQELAGRERHRLAVLEVRVGQDRGGAVGPGQEAEGRGVGDQDPVRKPVQLGHAGEVARVEGGDDRVVRGVEDGGDELEVLAVAQAPDELTDRERLAPHDAVLIAPPDPDLPDVTFLDSGPELFSSALLRVRPQAVTFDETRP